MAFTKNDYCSNVKVRSLILIRMMIGVSVNCNLNCFSHWPNTANIYGENTITFITKISYISRRIN